VAFALGRTSRKNLVGVHNSLILVCERAIVLSDVDFTIGEGLRTLERQKQLVASGASQTLNSQHLKQADGWGHAVDLWALISAQVSWDWPLYFTLAKAMRTASLELGIPLVWGGVWDRKLGILAEDLEEEVAEYTLRMKRVGKKAFTDGPHYQLA
jgi:peptidoglycan L-alanyl-D-glutamate endopeptidase CwlK